MSDAIIVAIVTGALSFAGVLVSNLTSAYKTKGQIQQRLDAAQEVTQLKIDELTREVREHNNFARRMPVVEEQIKIINHRIKNLEENSEKNR